MRTKDQLNSPEFRENMSDLDAVLTHAGIKHELRPHMATIREPQVLKLLGYFPTGRWQIIIEYKDRTYSVIRGMVSFGQYEIMQLRNKKGTKGRKFGDPERFETAGELLMALTGKKLKVKHLK